MNLSQDPADYVKKSAETGRFECQWILKEGICPISYTAKQTAKNHVKDIHLHQYDGHFWCNYCDRHDRKQPVVIVHQLGVHRNPRKDGPLRQCPACSAYLANLSDADHKKACPDLGDEHPLDQLPGREWNRDRKTFLYTGEDSGLVKPLPERPIIWKAGFGPNDHSRAVSHAPDSNLPPDIPFAHLPPFVPFTRPRALDPPINDWTLPDRFSRHNRYHAHVPAPRSSPPRGPPPATLGSAETPRHQDQSSLRSLAKARANLSYRKAGIYGRALEKVRVQRS